MTLPYIENLATNSGGEVVPVHVVRACFSTNSVIPSNVRDIG